MWVEEIFVGDFSVGDRTWENNSFFLTLLNLFIFEKLGRSLVNSACNFVHKFFKLKRQYFLTTNILQKDVHFDISIFIFKLATIFEVKGFYLGLSKVMFSGKG